MRGGGPSSGPQDRGGWAGPEESCFLLHFASCVGVVPCWRVRPVLEGQLVEEPSVQQRAGRGEGGEGCAAPQRATASVSPRSALWMRPNAAAFSASRCPAVTRKPSSGGGGSLRGSPRLRGSRETWRFRGLARSPSSHVGEPCPRVRFCPFAASASLACWHCFWEGTAAGEEDGGPSWLAFFEDLWGSPAWDVAGPLVLCAGGKPRVEL